MPTYMEKDGVLCTKFACFYKREEGSSLPSVQATVLLLDPEYGNVKAVSYRRQQEFLLQHLENQNQFIVRA